MNKVTNMKVYDFKQAKKFSIDNIRFLKLMCGEFCRTSNIHFNYEFKDLKIKLSVIDYTQSSHSEILCDTDKDSIIVEFDIKPMVEGLLLIMDKTTALILMDLCSGGNGEVYTRDLTAIDTEVLTYLMGNLLKKLYKPNGCEYTEITEVYTNTAQYNNSLGDDVFICSYTINTLKGVIGNIDMCIPYSNLEGILDQIVVDKFISTTSDNKNTITMYETVKDINLNVMVELGTSDVTLTDIEMLQEGSILTLNRLVTDDVIVNISGSKVYSGKFGLNESKKGVLLKGLVEDGVDTSGR